MKKTIRILSLMILGLVVGCDGYLTSPDDDDMGQLVAAIGNMPPDQQSIMYRERDRSRADEWLEKNKSRRIGTVKCPDKEEEIDAGDLLAHLLDPAYSGQTFVDLLDTFRQRVEKTYPGCEFDWDVQTQRDLFDELEREDDQGAARWLIALSVIELSRMPSLMAALGITTGAGGVMIALDGIGLLLCPLSTSVMCPDDPGAPGVPQQGQGGGGER